MPTQTADRHSTARLATMKGRHCCANSPMKFVEPIRMWDEGPGDSTGEKTEAPKIEINPVTQDNLQPQPIHSQWDPVQKSKRKTSFNWGGFVLTNKDGAGKYSAEKQTRRVDVKIRAVSHVPTFSATDYSTSDFIDKRRKAAANPEYKNTSVLPK